MHAIRGVVNVRMAGYVLRTTTTASRAVMGNTVSFSDALLWWRKIVVIARTAVALISMN